MPLIALIWPSGKSNFRDFEIEKKKAPNEERLADPVGNNGSEKTGIFTSSTLMGMWEEP